MARLLREELQAFDDMNFKDPNIPDDIPDDSSLPHIYLGAAQRPLTLKKLKTVYAKDEAICKITASMITNFFQDHLRENRPSTPIQIVGEKVSLICSRLS